MKLNIHPKQILSAALLATLTAPQALFAGLEWVQDGTISTHVASTCVVDEGSLGRYFTTLAGLHSSLGSVVARCPVKNDMDFGQPPWTSMQVTYRDPDGAGPTYQVKVSLRRVHFLTGNSSTISTFDSNLYPFTGVEAQSVSLVHSFDFTTYSYYLEATVMRPSTNLGVVGQGPLSGALYVVSLVGMKFIF